MEDDRRNWRSEGSHPALLFLLWTGWKKGEGERRTERPWATDWTDFLHGVMPGTGSAASGSGNKSGHKATASGGERVSRLMTYQIQRADGDIQLGRNLCFLLIYNLQSFGDWGSGYQGPLIKGWLWTLHWKTFGVKFTLKLFFTKKCAVHFANNYKKCTCLKVSLKIWSRKTEIVFSCKKYYNNCCLYNFNKYVLQCIFSSGKPKCCS